MTEKERDEKIAEVWVPPEVLQYVEEKPHYIYVSAILFDGKIWKWRISIKPMDLLTESIIFPKNIDIKSFDFGMRMTAMNIPVWVKDLDEHNAAFDKLLDIYKNYPIHEDFCMGNKPY